MAGTLARIGSIFTRYPSVHHPENNPELVCNSGFQARAHMQSAGKTRLWIGPWKQDGIEIGRGRTLSVAFPVPIEVGVLLSRDFDVHQELTFLLLLILKLE
ncbi:hypothetical protein MLD38_032239 [Melastoma candidum]|uniref:Uncharacterized protein n=1 Tax=Melastoma candidum TaxID=119954 RepID=A0ACB9M5G4_9MYRT|nr:hypothetical protein MLD38_032239 [Melastoma candidum]